MRECVCLSIVVNIFGKSTFILKIGIPGKFNQTRVVLNID